MDNNMFGILKILVLQNGQHVIAYVMVPNPVSISKTIQDSDNLLLFMPYTLEELFQSDEDLWEEETGVDDEDESMLEEWMQDDTPEVKIPNAADIASDSDITCDNNEIWTCNSAKFCMYRYCPFTDDAIVPLAKTHVQTICNPTQKVQLVYNHILSLISNGKIEHVAEEPEDLPQATPKVSTDVELWNDMKKRFGL